MLLGYKWNQNDTPVRLFAIVILVDQNSHKCIQYTSFLKSSSYSDTVAIILGRHNVWNYFVVCIFRVARNFSYEFPCEYLLTKMSEGELFIELEWCISLLIRLYNISLSRDCQICLISQSKFNTPQRLPLLMICYIKYNININCMCFYKYEFIYIHFY